MAWLVTEYGKRDVCELTGLTQKGAEELARFASMRLEVHELRPLFADEQMSGPTQEIVAAAAAGLRIKGCDG